MDHPVSIGLDIKIKSQIKSGSCITSRVSGERGKIDSSVESEFDFSRIQFIAEKKRNDHLGVCRLCKQDKNARQANKRFSHNKQFTLSSAHRCRSNVILTKVQKASAMGRTT